ncbi:MAG: hypothetical protein KF705_07675 [Phycisphaeraceae bacterium]|nr:hypothetical protein [Phycisphaeraceae bacterium]
MLVEDEGLNAACILCEGKAGGDGGKAEHSGECRRAEDGPTPDSDDRATWMDLLETWEGRI